ncbi:unnamed protein product [Zymoseptoria tritici ST99CH_3D1]|uniref:Uncharacterized protein n=1 Tax=Zymoseptoria tritici ST99CH_1E4 TaxID=1276532 RepID=A0A2H1FIY6_ZYMTR|nr:unnamed protein product [Zymoseptoria tritici ST99CH_1E4]SMR43490.1 unnamed protein product [Zymoseptoria tritici ST99CH_3D1]
MHLFSILAIVLPVTSALAADVEARYYNNPPKCGVQGYDKARPGKGERGGHVLGIGIDHILRLFCHQEHDEMHDGEHDEEQGDEHDKEHDKEHDADHNVFARDHNIFAHDYYNDTHHANVNHYLSHYHHRVPNYYYNILHYHGHNDLNNYQATDLPTFTARDLAQFCGDPAATFAAVFATQTPLPSSAASNSDITGMYIQLNADSFSNFGSIGAGLDSSMRFVVTETKWQARRPLRDPPHNFVSPGSGSYLTFVQWRANQPGTYDTPSCALDSVGNMYRRCYASAEILFFLRQGGRRV